MATLVKAFKPNSNSDFIFAEIIRKNQKTTKYIKTYDAIIVGGGPAGAYCGYCLAKKGLQAIILDHSHPREKPCGGVISNRAFKKFPIIHAVPYTFDVRNPFEIISSSGQTIQFEKNRGHSVSRRILDRYLLDSAVKQGCKWVQEKAISITNEHGLWIVKTNESEFRARIIVGADGVTSIVRKSVSTPFNDNDLARGIEYLVEGTEGEISKLQFLQNRPGYFWKVNRGVHSSVGVVDQTGNFSLLKNDLDKFLNNNYRGIRPLMRMDAYVPRPSSVEFFTSPRAGKNWLLIGDAAGHVHPLTGEGVLYALWSAELAAQAIYAGDTRLYEAFWREEYGKELVNAVIAHKIFYSKNILDTMLWFSVRSKTLSDIMFTVFSGNSTTNSAWMRTLLNIPRIGIETMFSGVKSAFV